MSGAIGMCLVLLFIVFAALAWVAKSNQHEGRVERTKNPLHNMRHFVDITELDEKDQEYIEAEIEWLKGGRKGEITKKNR